MKKASTIKSSIAFKPTLKSKIKVKKQRVGLKDVARRIRDLSDKEMMRLNKTLRKIEKDFIYEDGLNRIEGGFANAKMTDSDRETIDATLTWGVKNNKVDYSYPKEFTIDRKTMDVINVGSTEAGRSVGKKVKLSTGQEATIVEIHKNSDGKIIGYEVQTDSGRRIVANENLIPSMAIGGDVKDSGKYQTNDHDSKPTDYKTICKIIRQDGKEVQVCYGETNDGKNKSIEVYSGKNYIVGSEDVSFSKKYDDVSEVPVKYKSVVSELVTAHGKRFECGGAMEAGGRVGKKIRFTGSDYDQLINDRQNNYPFYSTKEGNNYVLKSEAHDIEVAKYYPEKEQLLISSNVDLRNWLHKKGYLSSPDSMEAGGKTKSPSTKALFKIIIPNGKEYILSDDSEYEFTHFIASKLTKKWFGHGPFDVRLEERISPRSAVFLITVPKGKESLLSEESEYDFTSFIGHELTKKWHGNGAFDVSLQKKFECGGMMSKGGEIEVRKILERKKNGVDNTEEESAEIKGFLKEHIVQVGTGYVQLIEDIQTHFPIEYGEALDEMEGISMEVGGKVRSEAQYNKLVDEKERIVKKLSPKQVADMWNKEAGAVKGGLSEPVTEDWGKSDVAKMYLRNLLIEKELTESEYNKYFSKGGEIVGGGSVNGFFTGDGKTFINVAVGKSSPNRKGDVVKITERDGVKWALVQFRDFSEEIRFDEDSMVSGGFVSKGEMVWNKLTPAKRSEFLYENFTPEITPRSQEILVGKAYNFLPKNVKIKIEAKYANVEEGQYSSGGSITSRGRMNKQVLVKIVVPKGNKFLLEDDAYKFREYISSLLTKNWFGNGAFEVRTKKITDNEILLNVTIPMGKEYSVEDNFKFTEWLSSKLTRNWFGNGSFSVSIVKRKEERGSMEAGGGVDKLYKGKKGLQGGFVLWSGWNPEQRIHFLNDHKYELETKTDYFASISKKDWMQIPIDVQNAVKSHFSEGQYSSGGRMESGGSVESGNILIKLGILEQKLNNKGVALKDFDEHRIASNATFEGYDIEEYGYTDDKGKRHKLPQSISDMIDEYNSLSDDYYETLTKK